MSIVSRYEPIEYRSAAVERGWKARRAGICAFSASPVARCPADIILFRIFSTNKSQVLYHLSLSLQEGRITTVITLRQGDRSIDLYVHGSHYCFGNATKIILSEWEDPLGYAFYTLTENVIPESVFLDADSFFVPRQLLENRIAWPILQQNQVLEPVPAGIRLPDGRPACRLRPDILLDTDSRHPGNREAFLRFWGFLSEEGADSTGSQHTTTLLREVALAQEAGSVSQEITLALEQILSTLDKLASQRLYTRYALDFDRWMAENTFALHTIDQAGMLAYRHFLRRARTRAVATGSWSVARRCLRAALQLNLRSDDPAAAIRGLRITSISTRQEE